MKSGRIESVTRAVALVVVTLALPITAHAQTRDDWQFQAIIYGYFPDIGGTTSFPERGGSSINVDASKLIDNLKFTFMGTFEARKGRYGFLTDILYLDVGGSNTGTRNLSIDGHEPPVGVTANANLDLKGAVWELAGTYRAIAEPAATVDLLAGARLLDLKQTLSYSLSADVGPLVGPGRSGSSNVKVSYWDAIVGAKGRFSFGANRQWFVPWYADVGTGQSDLTWQVIGGLGYAFSWGQVIGGWRYIDYKFKSSSEVQSLDFNGPMLGVAFSW
ncbi:MAG: hypothetical protein ABI593_07115 [Betaproteobacteria bacterium]